jgi:hypothetical protein
VYFSAHHQLLALIGTPLVFPEISMNEMAHGSTVTVPKNLLFGLLTLAFVSVVFAAGVGSGIAIRAGVARPVANGAMWLVIFASLYPYMKVRSLMRGSRLEAPFWQWLVAAAAGAVVSASVVAITMRIF